MPLDHGPFIINPYIAGSPIKDTAMFFGREDVYAWLRQHLRGAYQDNVIVLYGERRSGKTSILYQMEEGLGDDRYIPVLLDLQGMGLEGMDGFLWEVARKIVRALRSVDGIPKFDRPARRDFEANPRHEFEDVFLPPIIDGLGQRRLLLMFDETNRLAEKIQSGQLPHDVYDYLRSLVQQVDQINFLFSLGRRIELSDKGSSQLLNIAVYRKISFLDQDYAEDLIARPVAQYYSYTRPAIDRILKLTFGQPYYTQLLCHNLFTRWTQDKPEQLDVADVEAVLPDVMEQGTPNFQFVWEDSTPAEQAVLAALADAAPRYRGGVMRRNLERRLHQVDLYPPQGDVTNGLKQLFERDLLNDKEPYEFQIELVELWLRKSKRLDWVVEELGEVVDAWKQLEMQRRAEAPTTAERVQRWAVPVLAVTIIALIVISAFLIRNIRQNQATNRALSTAEALRGTESARYVATVFAANTQIAKLEELEQEDNSPALATAQAAIDLAKITATAVQAGVAATVQAAETAGAIRNTATPMATNTPLPTTTPRPTPLPPTSTPAPIATPTPTPTRAALLRGTIAYPAFNEENRTYDLYFGDVTSGESKRYRTDASQPAFNADGSRIAFQSWARRSRGLLTANSAGGNEILITNFLEDELPTWSPDSASILFFSRRSGDRGAKLYLTNANADFQNNQAREMGMNGEYPGWGLDGQIVFKGWGNTAPGLRLTSADTTNIQDITLSGDDYAPALSPDGKQVAFMASNEDNWDVYVINVDGSNRRKLTANRASDGLPTWSPNGQTIAFVSDRDGEWAIYGINVDGSALRKLLKMAGSPDGIVPAQDSTGWLEERISWAP